MQKLKSKKVTKKIAKPKKTVKKVTCKKKMVAVDVRKKRKVCKPGEKRVKKHCVKPLRKVKNAKFYRMARPNKDTMVLLGCPP